MIAMDLKVIINYLEQSDELFDDLRVILAISLQQNKVLYNNNTLNLYEEAKSYI
ncbi:MAG: hypothetical protein ACTSUL_02135 [Promethearchaeota archaeon]